MTESENFYKHYDIDSAFITLHDCCAKNIYIKDGVISFYFENGFWITSDHECNNLNKTVRTDSSKVDFCLKQEYCEDMIVYVFRKNLFGSTIRKEWNLKKLMNLVNNKGFELEFLYQYKGYNEQIIDCCLHFDKKPYFYECQFKIPVYRMIYCWNSLLKDKQW